MADFETPGFVDAPMEEAPAEVAAEDRPPKDSPPTMGRPGRTAARKAKADDDYVPPPLTIPQIRTKLKQLLNTAGGLAMLANPADGQVILAHADAAADAYTELAKRHKSIRRAIEALEAGGAYGAAISVTLSMALPILANHNKLPAPLAPMAMLFGVSPDSENGNGN